jgi:predicted metal-dependent hydrolase
VDLHNFAYWWEAHEAWEGLWQLTDKRCEQAQFLQGLIQVSAALLKRHMGSPEGSEILFGEAIGRLAPIANAHPRYMGLDLPEYLGKVAAGRAGGPTPMIRLL